ncbi:Hydrogenase maturation factor HoxX [Fulvia fulva]|uniref:Hydrogenase maturation factor HoxX n=1 Tax=Passalora fulva TaxID=5499 RepID=A0A9Q8PGU7_PASFU|nr:Hydrogenase maturation factor HoxX [Fulvia fulva]KAK4613412.1 Hydrogenase maturation factor HoxX [Fulvia fulva]KAK4614455.1 Hydrogenase maturation factor HoxX [Fulvia fulva]UJO22251.1 Hydrogenase maturation factor HoxX [Fulvia fulva]WPV20721.1 Hydrogenase maturation factor HoxX [Fulvia fulva]WPV35249.1 Hydrogenase maturation factor HoxX [Fulvia fulva]
MKILFLCTAHNSLSQRLYLALSRTHDVSIEFALFDELMVTAVALFGPDLIICPFLTTLVPKEIYEEYLTLIIHPGPPGDAGPSALDWVLMGDDGATDDPEELLRKLDMETSCSPGRTHWGITVLQAIEQFDAGPVWAFEQFELDIDQAGLTKSELYRGPITQSAVTATLAAISRIQAVGSIQPKNGPSHSQHFAPTLKAEADYSRLSVTSNRPFQGGKLHHRPLLKAAHRQFDVTRHTAQQISRCIRSGDSQPGVLTKVFGINLYVYGGVLDDNADGRLPTTIGKMPLPILGFRNEAVCLSTSDGKGVWITHVRRLKAKADKALWPKVSATFGLLDLGLITAQDITALHWPLAMDWKLSAARTFQEVWVEWSVDDKLNKTAYLYFDFYNGAMSTEQCSHLIDAMDFIVAESTEQSSVQAVVLMGGSYFSNGIALNVIEAAQDPAMESWLNINRIDDAVHYLLHDFPSRSIVTVAAIRGNAAAGGVALATACDIVVAGSSVVLNPAYRAVGLYGSEYHTLSYYGRCGKINATKILTSMTPLSPLQAQSIGLVDYVFPGTGTMLEDYIKTHIDYLLKPGIFTRGMWKKNIDLSPAALARARANELGEMSLDFWSARSARYHSRRFDFVRKVKSTKTPLRFAIHRRMFDDTRKDEEETEDFDSVERFQQLAQEKLIADLRNKLANDVGEAIAYRDERARRDSIRLDRKIETVFSCYYKPTLEDVPTPPESPLSPIETFDRFSFM